MKFFEKEGCVVFGSNAAATEFIRILLKRGYKVVEVFAGEKYKKEFGPKAVRLDVSDIPVRVVDEVVKLL